MYMLLFLSPQIVVGYLRPRASRNHVVSSSREALACDSGFCAFSHSLPPPLAAVMLELVIPLRCTRTSSRTAAQLFFTQRALAGHKFKNKQSEQFRYLLRRRRTRKKLLASLCKRDLLGKGAAVRNAKPLFHAKKRQAKKTCRDVAPQVGLEPTTLRLTAACSTD